MDERYSDNKYGGNHQPYYCLYLSSELDFWKNIKENLDKYLASSDQTLKSFLLKQFNTYFLQNIIKKLENC